MSRRQWRSCKSRSRWKGSRIEAGRRHRWVPGALPPSSLPPLPSHSSPLKWSGLQDGAHPRKGVDVTPSCIPPATPSLTAQATSLLPYTAPFCTCCSRPTPCHVRRYHTDGIHGKLNTSIRKSIRRLGNALRTMVISPISYIDNVLSHSSLGGKTTKQSALVPYEAVQLYLPP